MHVVYVRSRCILLVWCHLWLYRWCSATTPVPRHSPCCGGCPSWHLGAAAWRSWAAQAAARAHCLGGLGWGWVRRVCAHGGVNSRPKLLTQIQIDAYWDGCCLLQPVLHCILFVGAGYCCAFTILSRAWCASTGRTSAAARRAASAARSGSCRRTVCCSTTRSCTTSVTDVPLHLMAR